LERFIRGEFVFRSWNRVSDAYPEYSSLFLIHDLRFGNLIAEANIQQSR